MLQERYSELVTPENTRVMAWRRLSEQERRQSKVVGVAGEGASAVGAGSIETRTGHLGLGISY